jgi:organic hydroperoxide reductase OsmC/OhrA
MSEHHHYEVHMTWVGNDGDGTRTYRSYRRDHLITAQGKPEIPGSSDPAFGGDPQRYNPEELLIASLSSCHMLWYLHLCAVGDIVVLSYEDTPHGVMEEDASGSGKFVDVELRPVVVIAPGGDEATAQNFHHEAHTKCFIANSVNFPVRLSPRVVGSATTGADNPAGGAT